ncbi:hypothetical protein KI387_013273, partial [Taxus chinensis]
MYAKDVNQPVQPKWGTLALDQLDKGTHGKRIAEGAESQSRNATCHRLNEEQGSPFQVDHNFLSQTALGHPGQMDVVDAKEPADPRTNQSTT